MVGEALPPGQDIAIKGIDLLAVGGDPDQAKLAELNDILTGLGMAPLRANVGPGVVLGLDVTAGSQQHRLTLPLTRPGTGRAEFVRQENLVGGATGLGAGPVRLEQLRLSYANGLLWLIADATFTACGMTVTATGVGLGVWLTTPSKVDWRLLGLGLDYDTPPVRILGALVNELPAPAGYALTISGAAIVTVPAFSLSAAASYSRGNTDGGTSFFAFMNASLAKGKGFGPPPFKVLGFMVGYGHNSTVRFPQVTQVADFPLVAGLTNPAAVGGTDPTPAAVIRAITDWIQPRQGRSWIAGGLQFSSFEFLTGTALVLAEWGSGFTVALIGLADMTFPKGTKKGIRPRGTAADRDVLHRGPVRVRTGRADSQLLPLPRGPETHGRLRGDDLDRRAV